MIERSCVLCLQNVACREMRRKCPCIVSAFSADCCGDVECVLHESEASCSVSLQEMTT